MQQFVLYLVNLPVWPPVLYHRPHPIWPLLHGRHWNGRRCCWLPDLVHGSPEQPHPIQMSFKKEQGLKAQTWTGNWTCSLIVYKNNWSYYPIYTVEMLYNNIWLDIKKIESHLYFIKYRNTEPHNDWTLLLQWSHLIVGICPRVVEVDLFSWCGALMSW